jgi:predicted unusual protein kinase regulating ubiquinone biosynthesis (AarF/ABC1/UbiB family)
LRTTDDATGPDLLPVSEDAADRAPVRSFVVGPAEGTAERPGATSEPLRPEGEEGPGHRPGRRRPSRLRGLDPLDLVRAFTIVATLAFRTVGALLRRPTTWRASGADGLADGLERLGPTFVKVGQLIASSPGAFPPDVVAACHRHLDRVRPVPVTHIESVIAADLGRPVAELFSSFDPVPLSAASVAQVHACTLHDGRDAVVKVQRPRIERPMYRDLRVLHALARAIDRSVPRTRSVNLPGLVADLHAVTRRELDFRHEAAAQTTFRTNLHALGDNALVTAPEAYDELCGPRVITMERLRGTAIDRYAVRCDDLEERRAVLQRVAKSWIEAVTVHGLFHGDLHGGNVWVLDDGRVAFLDFGINATLAPEWRELVAAIFYATALDGGFTRLARSTKAVGAIPDDAGTDEEVGERLAILAAPFAGTGIAEIGIGQSLGSIVTAFEQFGAKVPDELLLIAKQLLYLEGYTKVLAPDHDLLSDLDLLTSVFPEDVARLRRSRAEAEPPDGTSPP